MSKNNNNTAQLDTFIERYKQIENEIKMLQEDKKALIEDLKENHGVKPAVLRKAIRVAKIRSDLGDDINQFDHLVDAMEGTIK
jgi:uncharacterized protein (UPF0335 family)